MTTIAFDGKSVAADGWQMTDDGTIDRQHIQKIFEAKTNRYAVVGGAGETDAVNAFVEWIMGGTPKRTYPEICKERADYCEYFAVTVDGLLEMYERTAKPVSSSKHIDAFGSGRRLALGAMAAGASAENAVRIASQFDIRTGGKITVIDL